MRLNIKDLYNLCKIKDDKTDIFISSDMHGYHKNLCKGSTTWGNPELNCRDFKDEFEMTDIMIDNLNSVVREQDIFIHLGDVAFGGKGNVQKLLNRINCKNIVLLSGNHDYDTQKPENVILECDYLELRLACKTLVCMFHYPITIWNECHKNSLNLFGHSHNKHRPKGRSKDVGLDTNNLFPYKLTDIIKELEQIPIHNPNELSH